MTEIQRSLHGLVGVGAALRGIQSEVSKTFGEAKKFHTQALAQGTSIGDFSSDFKSGINQLAGSVTGYSDAINTSFALYSSGLRSSNKGLHTLAGFTKMTGGNVNALTGQLASNLAGGKFTDKQMTTLGEHTVELSQRFGITSNSLVGALKGLGAEVNNFKALGLLDESAEVGMRLAAALGPAMAGAGSELLSAFAGGSGMIKAEILGLGNERRAFLAGGAKSAQSGVDLILKAGKNATAQVERFTKGAADPAYALLLATQVLGKEVVQAANVRAQLEMKAKQAGAKSVEAYVATTKQQGKISKEYTRTMGALKQQIMGPLQSVIFSMMEVVTALLNIPAVHALIKFLGQVGVIVGTLVIGVTSLAVAIYAAISGTIRLANTLTSSILTYKKVGINTTKLNASIERLIAAYKSPKTAGKGTGRHSVRGPDGRFAKSADNGQKTANKQRGAHTKKLAGAAGALLILSATFGDQLPEWVNTGINLAFGVTSLVAAIKMLGAGQLFSGLFSGMKSIFGKAKGVGGSILGKFTGGKGVTTTAATAAKEGIGRHAVRGPDGRFATAAGGTALDTTTKVKAPKGASKLTKFVKVLKDVGRGIGDFIKSVGKGIGDAIKGIFKGMAEGVKYMSDGKVLKGAKNMIVVGAAVVLLGYGLKTMVGVGISTIVALAGALITTALMMKYFATSKVLKGAAGMAAVGSAIGVLGLALKVIGNIPTNNLIKAGVAILFFSGAALALGAIISTGYGGVAFVLGIAGLFALGLALIPLGVAALLAAPGLYGLAEALKAVSGVSWKNLALVTAMLPALGVALAGFSAGGMVSGLFSLGGFLSGGDSPIDTLKALAETAGPIVKLAAAITLLSKGMEQLAKVPAIDPNISKTLQLDGLSSGTPRSTGPSSSPQFAAAPTGKLNLKNKTEEELRAMKKASFPKMIAAKQAVGEYSTKGTLKQGTFTGTATGNIQGALEAELANNVVKQINFAISKIKGTRESGVRDVHMQALSDSNLKVKLFTAALAKNKSATVDPVAANRGKFAPRDAVQPFNHTWSGEGSMGVGSGSINISQPTSSREMFEDIQAARIERDLGYTDMDGNPDAMMYEIAQEQLAFSKSLFKVVQALETKMGYSIDQNMTNAAMQNLTAEEANIIATGRPTSGPGGGRGREVGD